MKLYGYARVSSKDQNLSRQLEAFKLHSIPDKNIYTDKQSGKDFNRENYQKSKKKLKKGDCIFIKSIDRLGRNYTEIINEWNELTKVIHCDIVVLDMSLLDTRERKDKIGKFISDIVLQILFFVAENERVDIKQRQLEGIKLAKEKGIRFGRPKTTYKNDFLNVARLYHTQVISLQDVLKMLNMKKSTFFYHIKKIYS